MVLPRPTHDDDIGHAGEGGLLYLVNLVLVNAQLLEAFRYVCRHGQDVAIFQTKTINEKCAKAGLFSTWHF